MLFSLSESRYIGHDDDKYRFIYSKSLCLFIIFQNFTVIYNFQKSLFSIIFVLHFYFQIFWPELLLLLFKRPLVLGNGSKTSENLGGYNIPPSVLFRYLFLLVDIYESASLYLYLMSRQKYYLAACIKIDRK